jgi:hypothetical protein
MDGFGRFTAEVDESAGEDLDITFVLASDDNDYPYNANGGNFVFHACEKFKIVSHNVSQRSEFVARAPRVITAPFFLGSILEPKYWLPVHRFWYNESTRFSSVGF